MCLALRSRRRDNFSVARFFWKLTKKDTNVRVAGRRKQTKKKEKWSNCEWMIFQWVSMSSTIRWYRTQQKSLCKHRCQVPKFLQNPQLLLTASFCPIDTTAIASSARSTFAFSLIDVFSFVLRCFHFFELATDFSAVPAYL